MSLLWLIAWGVAGLPPVFVGPTWDTWGLVLVAAAAFDLGAANILAYRRLTRPEVQRVWRPGIGWTDRSPDGS
jgi:hypothetical protein